MLVAVNDDVSQCLDTTIFWNKDSGLSSDQWDEWNPHMYRDVLDGVCILAQEVQSVGCCLQELLWLFNGLIWELVDFDERHTHVVQTGLDVTDSSGARSGLVCQVSQNERFVVLTCPPNSSHLSIQGFPMILCPISFLKLLRFFEYHVSLSLRLQGSASQGLRSLGNLCIWSARWTSRCSDKVSTSATRIHQHQSYANQAVPRSACCRTKRHRQSVFSCTASSASSSQIAVLNVVLLLRIRRRFYLTLRMKFFARDERSLRQHESWPPQPEYAWVLVFSVLSYHFHQCRYTLRAGSWCGGMSSKRKCVVAAVLSHLCRKATVIRTCESVILVDILRVPIIVDVLDGFQLCMAATPFSLCWALQWSWASRQPGYKLGWPAGGNLLYKILYVYIGCVMA